MRRGSKIRCGRLGSLGDVGRRGEGRRLPRRLGLYGCARVWRGRRRRWWRLWSALLFGRRCRAGERFTLVMFVSVCESR